jgi:hypothetical protein
MNKNPQSLIGQTFRIHKLKEMGTEWEQTGMSKEEVKELFAHEDQEAKVISIETAGDFEDIETVYYNVKFKDCYEITGLSSYHIDYSDANCIETT